MLHGVMLTLQGTHQGSVLTPYLFFRYISDLVGIIAQSGFGCKVVNQPVNIISIYADDSVLIASSWTAP